MYLVLVAWGWFSICGASYDFVNPDIFGWSTNSGKQLVWIGTSLVLGFMLLLVEKRFYDTSAYFIYMIMIMLLLVTIVIAPETKGSRSWIPIGSVKLQPAEFSKFAVALTIAKFMNTYGFTLSNTRQFIKVLALVMLPMLLIICQKETGSALVYLAFFLVLYREGMTGAFLFTAFAMIVYFVVGLRYGENYIDLMPVSVGEFVVHLLISLFTIGMAWVFGRSFAVVKILFCAVIGGTVLALLFSAYVIPFDVCSVQLFLNVLMIVALLVCSFAMKTVKFAYVASFALLSIGFYYACGYVFEKVLQPHQRVRIEVLLGMNDDVRKAGYNVNQAKIAIGSGGFAGKGFLNGTQTKLRYVPEQDTDFIFCTIGEEEGFVGSAGLLLFYLIFILRLLVLAERQPDTMGRVYGYSVLCIFLFHLFVNVGMVLGLTPVIGIPLPFFSYGGSSLWGFTILLFIFLRMDAERSLKSAG
jgi:rod shape determining protein RodA